MPPTWGVMYPSSPGTAAAIAGTARAHRSGACAARALFIVRTLVSFVYDALQVVVQIQRQQLRQLTALRTQRKCESSRCGENAASGAAVGTGKKGAGEDGQRKTQH